MKHGSPVGITSAFHTGHYVNTSTSSPQVSSEPRSIIARLRCLWLSSTCVHSFNAHHFVAEQHRRDRLDRSIFFSNRLKRYTNRRAQALNSRHNTAEIPVKELILLNERANLSVAARIDTY